MTLADYALSYNGVNLGPGSSLVYTSLTGLQGLPAVRSYSTARDGSLGIYSSPFYEDQREIVGDILIACDGINTATGVVQGFLDAFGLQTAPLPLVFKLPGAPEKVINCRCDSFPVPVNVDYQSGLPATTIRFIADDPRIYSSTAHGVTIGAPSPGALVSPWTSPITITGASRSTVNCNNAGNWPATPTLFIVGPATTPIISNLTTNQSMQILYTLAAGDVVAINTQTSSITLNDGQQPGLIAAGAPFITLAPGDNVINFSSNTGSLVVAWLDSWIS